MPDADFKPLNYNHYLRSALPSLWRCTYFAATAAATSSEAPHLNMSTEPCRVLLFEDNSLDAVYFCETLADSEYTRFVVDVVATLAEGIAKLSAAAHEYQLLVVDLSLPDCEGLQTFEKVTAAAARLPVVILSGYDDREMAVHAVQLGAQDYLVKGDFQSYNLEKSLSFAIERRRLQEDVKATAVELQSRMEASLLAKHIQENLFPERTPRLPGFDLAACSFPADETGGDFYDYLLSRFTPAAPGGQGTVGLLIGDVGGHGIGPALMMSAVRSYMRALQRHTASLSELLYEVNNQITIDTRHERLISLFMAELNINARTFCHCGAGHESHVLRADGTVETLSRATFPLGIEFDVVFPVSEPVQLHTDDIMVFHTDGIAEAKNRQSQPYGIDRLLTVVQSHRNKHAAEIIDAVYADVQLHTGLEQQRDDITLLLLKTLPAA